LTALKHRLKFDLFLKTTLHSKKKNSGSIFGSNMDKLTHWVKCLNYIFNPTFGFVQI